MSVPLSLKISLVLRLTIIYFRSFIDVTITLYFPVRKWFGTNYCLFPSIFLVFILLSRVFHSRLHHRLVSCSQNPVISPLTHIPPLFLSHLLLVWREVAPQYKLSGDGPGGPAETSWNEDLSCQEIIGGGGSGGWSGNGRNVGIYKNHNWIKISAKNSNFTSRTTGKLPANIRYNHRRLSGSSWPVPFPLSLRW